MIKVLDLSKGSLSKDSSDKHLADFYERSDGRVVIYASQDTTTTFMHTLPHISVELDSDDFVKMPLLNVKYALIREVAPKEIEQPRLPIEGSAATYYWVRAFREGNNKLMLMQLVREVADYKALQTVLTLSKSNKQFKEEGVWGFVEKGEQEYPFALIFDVLQIKI